MRVISIGLKGFRNIEDIEFKPCAGVNIIYGNNAQGKTNLIEAIWLFTGLRGFRAAKEAEYISLSGENASCKLCFESGCREQDAEINLGRLKKKRVVLNGAEKDSVSAFSGRFCAVVFSPAQLEIISGAPSERRKFIDSAICQVKPAYAKYLKEYARIIEQRNTLLKDIAYHSELKDTLPMWDSQLAACGAVIMLTRSNYIQMLAKKATDIYGGLSGGAEQFTVKYLPSAQFGKGETKQEIYERLYKLLCQNLNEDIRAGYTSAGPHRDDIETEINGISVKSYGSQGQKRSAVLSLKLAESELLREYCGEEPIILLDDVMSELDQKRQDYILNHSAGGRFS